MAMPPTASTPQTAGQAMAQLLPYILRGVHTDFLTAHALTQRQFVVLVVLQTAPDCTMGRLARQMGTRMPTATGLVGRLVRRGYVRRAGVPADRRCVTVELTAKGRTVIRQFQTAVQRRWEDVLRALQPRELEAFHHVVTTLRQRLAATP